jgi:Ran GTPase-activating protein (RanGAP) involved in mRNA processing and transport
MIRQLDLSGNKFQDAGVMQICKYLSETTIQKVDLSSNRISDRVVEAMISNLKGATHLKQINLADNKELTSNKASMNKLKNGLAQKRIMVHF